LAVLVAIPFAVAASQALVALQLRFMPPAPMPDIKELEALLQALGLVGFVIIGVVSFFWVGEVYACTLARQATVRRFQ
jgi:heme/copper-type cytochrome/quinol oxidase subunit 2